MVQVAIYLYPLLWVKVIISLVEGLRAGQYLYLVIPFGMVNLVFGVLLLTLLGRQLRLLDFPLVFLLELDANIYFILVLLALRLIILGYFLYKDSRYSMGFYF